MGLELKTIKFTDEQSGTTSYGTCPAGALEHWLRRGYEESTPEEAAAAARGEDAPSEQDVAQGLVLDPPADLAAPKGEADPIQVEDPAAPKVGELSAPAEVLTQNPDGQTVEDSTAGDDAESNADDKSARGGRRQR